MCQRCFRCGWRVGAGSAVLKLASRLAVLPLCLWCCSANAVVENDFEPPAPWVEGTFTLPPPPDKAAFEPFYVSAVTNNDFYLDRHALVIGGDGVTRYTMVVRSSSGAETATFEGIRCQSAEWKMYATASRSGQWIPVRASAWRLIEESNLNRARAALAKEYICDNGIQVRSVPEILTKLRRSMSRY